MIRQEIINKIQIMRNEDTEKSINEKFPSLYSAYLNGRIEALNYVISLFLFD